MKKIFIIFLLITSMFLVACNSNEKSSIFRKDFEKQFTTAYSEKELINRLVFRIISPNNMFYLVSTKKAFPNGKFVHLEDTSYAIYKLKEGGYCYLLFKNFDDVISGDNGIGIGAFVVKDYLSVASFDSLEINESTVEDVIALDRGLETLLKYQKEEANILHASVLRTFHLSDGGFIQITYKNEKAIRYNQKDHSDLTPEETLLEVKESIKPENFVVEKIEFVENGGLLFEEAYTERVMEKGELVAKYDYNKYSTTLKEEDFPFK